LEAHKINFLAAWSCFVCAIATHIISGVCFYYGIEYYALQLFGNQYLILWLLFIILGDRRYKFFELKKKEKIEKKQGDTNAKQEDKTLVR
jgi:hypothetical protein